MKLRTIAGLFLSVILIIEPVVVFSYETDQYNLPPRPLADIGDEVSDYVEQNLSKAIYKINSQILARQQCLEANSQNGREIKCDAPERELARLEFLRSEDAVAREVYNLLGTGVPPLTSSGTWMEKHDFKMQPSRFRTGFWKSIYLILPIDYIGIGSTVNVYGAQFGTDKVAHFFQQGYDYYKIYKDALKEGLTPEKAAEKAIKWGQKTERTYFGTLLTGVYSNADLCANYVGMKFYLGLTREIEIAGNQRAPVLVLKDGIWAFNEEADLRKSLLKPFLTNHLNEALNPSIFTKHLGLRAFVRRSVKKHSCSRWLEQYPTLSSSDFNKISRALIQWNGEDYGFTDSENFITIANTCFSEK